MIFSALRLRHPTTLILLLLSFELEAQSLILNSGFDTNLDQWNLGGLVLPVWDSSDANNNPGSGSALIKNTFPDAFSDEAVLTQCLFDGAGGYELGVRINIPSGQARTGSVVIRYFYFANSTTCEGGSSGTGGVLRAAPFDEWVYLAGNPFNAIIKPTGSIQYVIAIRKTEAGGEFKAYVEGRLPSAGGSLQRLI